MMTRTGNQNIVRMAKLLFGFLSLTMIYLVIDTSLKSNMFALPVEVVHEPWFITTLYDFYFNIIILSAWVIYKEKNPLSTIAWILSFICLGSIATSFYVFLQFLRLKRGDPFEKILLRNS